MKSVPRRRSPFRHEIHDSFNLLKRVLCIATNIPTTMGLGVVDNYRLSVFRGQILKKIRFFFLREKMFAYQEKLQ